MKRDIYIYIWNNTNLISLFGIHIYLMIFYYYINIIPIIIYINGVLAHSSISFKSHKYIRYYDISVNVILIIYVNIYTIFNYYTYLMTSLVGLIFVLKHKLTTEHSLVNQITHVLGIHIPLAQYLIKFLENY